MDHAKQKGRHLLRDDVSRNSLREQQEGARRPDQAIQASLGQHNPREKYVGPMKEQPPENFVIGPATIHDIQLFFGDEDAERLDEFSTWEDVAVASGFFPSRTQAMKNGWGGPIPVGWTERGFGRLTPTQFKHKVFVLKIGP